jgi:hypothetical protein
MPTMPLSRDAGPSADRARPPYPNALKVVSPAFVLSLGVDLFLHGGLFARFYVAPSGFLLPAEQAFRRIPLGYLGLLVVTAGLFWVCRQLRVSGVRAGWRLGFSIGIAGWGGLVLGLYSISTAGAPLLLAWWIGQSIELGIAGGVIGAMAAGVPSRRVWRWVAISVVGLLTVTVALQSLGIAPSMRAR